MLFSNPGALMQLHWLQLQLMSGLMTPHRYARRQPAGLADKHTHNTSGDAATWLQTFLHSYYIRLYTIYIIQHSRTRTFHQSHSAKKAACLASASPW